MMVFVAWCLSVTNAESRPCTASSYSRLEVADAHFSSSCSTLWSVEVPPFARAASADRAAAAPAAFDGVVSGDSSDNARRQAILEPQLLPTGAKTSPRFASKGFSEEA